MFPIFGFGFDFFLESHPIRNSLRRKGVQSFHRTLPLFCSCKYKALAFFPAYDESEYCIRNTTNDGFYWSAYNNVRYVVARYSPTQLDAANRMWRQNVSSAASKIQQAFR